MNGRWRWIGLGVVLSLWGLRVLADAHEAEAQAKIEVMPCGSSTIGAKLAEETHIHSRRDLGWRFFPDSGYLDVERALRVSKSMEIRYRWRVDNSGRVEPLSDPARELCQ